MTEKRIVKRKIINGFPIGDYGAFCVITEDGSIYHRSAGGKNWDKIPDIEEIVEVK